VIPYLDLGHSHQLNSVVPTALIPDIIILGVYVYVS